MQASSSNPNTSTENARAVLNNGIDPTMDLRKSRSILSNRLSTQRARERKAQYISDLEKTVNYLEGVIIGVASQMTGCKEQINLLMEQNQSLQTLLELRLNEAKFSEIEVQKKQMEVNRLRELLQRAVHMNNRGANGGSNQMQDHLDLTM
ncbi:hypothetical protein ACS0TY_007999 [Phlomoides rotata]